MAESTSLPDNNDVSSYNNTEGSQSATITDHIGLSICGFGLVCNTLAMCLMSRKELRKLSTSVYLTSLSVFDNVSYTKNQPMTLNCCHANEVQYVFIMGNLLHPMSPMLRKLSEETAHPTVYLHLPYGHIKLFMHRFNIMT